jgi:hypothetical protein
VLGASVGRVLWSPERPYLCPFGRLKTAVWLLRLTLSFAPAILVSNPHPTSFWYDARSLLQKIRQTE